MDLQTQIEQINNRINALKENLKQDRINIQHKMINEKKNKQPFESGIRTEVNQMYDNTLTESTETLVDKIRALENLIPNNISGGSQDISYQRYLKYKNKYMKLKKCTRLS